MLRHPRSTLTGLFCIALAATGCAPDPDRGPDAQAVADAINVVFYHGKWRQMPATPENQAETIIFEQRVNFSSSSGLLDRAGATAIDRLLREADLPSGSVLRLSVAGADGTGAFDRLTLQRLESVRIALVNRGYKTALAEEGVARVSALGPNEVGVTAAKVMAVLPDCDQPQPVAPNPPQFDRGFGCSTAYNLGVMIDDPNDLIHGRPLDPADAERAALSVKRYRVGEEKPLLEWGTQSQ